MTTNFKFHKEDFEGCIWDSIEEENRIAGYPKGRPRYPEITKVFGDINIIAFWKVVNTNTKRKKESVYSEINYVAWIDDIQGHLIGKLPTKCVAHSTKPD